MISSRQHQLDRERYVYRFAEDVYLKAYKKEYRFFKTRHEFVDWLIAEVGDRPSSRHHLYLTGVPEAPAEWRKVSNTFIRDYINETTERRD